MSERWSCRTEAEFLECCGVAGLRTYQDELWCFFEPLSEVDRRRMLDMAHGSLRSSIHAKVMVECLREGVPFSYMVELVTGFDTSQPIVQLYKAGVPASYFMDVADFSKMVYDPVGFALATHAAGISAGYAVSCAGRFSIEKTAAMWREGIPLEYVEAIP